MKQTGGEAAEPPHKARLGHWRNTQGEKPQGCGQGRIKQGEGRQCSGYVHNKKRVNVAIKSKWI